MRNMTQHVGDNDYNDPCPGIFPYPGEDKTANYLTREYLNWEVWEWKVF